MMHRLLATILLLIGATLCHAQQLAWESLDGPNGGSLYGLIVIDSVEAFAVWDGGVFRTSDLGITWTTRNAGITADTQAVRNGLLGLGTTAIAQHDRGRILLVAANAGIFRSSDRGSTWTLDEGSSHLPHATIVATGLDSVILASDYEAVVRSTDLGRTWDSTLGRSRDRGIEAVSDTARRLLYLRRGTTVYRSTDLGESWALAIDSIAGGAFPHLALGRSGVLFASGMSSGLRRSTDAGLSWHEVAADQLPQRMIDVAADASGRVVTADAAGTVFASVDNGESFEITGKITVPLVELILSGGHSILARTASAGVLRSTNNGATWQDANTGLTATAVKAVATTPSGKIVAGTGDELFLSDDASTWSNAAVESTQRRSINAIVRTSRGALLAGTTRGIVRSDDDGVTWDTTILVDAIQTQDQIWEIVETPWGTLFGGTFNGMLRSTDDGRSWHNAGLGGLPVQALAVRADGVMIAASGSFFYAGLRRSIDRGESWDDASLGITSRGVNELAFTSGGIALAATVDGLFRSPDAGITWTRVDTMPRPARFVGVVEVPRGPIVAATSDDIFLSSDEGLTWRRDTFAVVEPILTLVADLSGRLLIGTYGAGAFRSVTSVAAIRAERQSEECIGRLMVAPNPTASSAVLEFDQCGRGPVVVSVVDALGRRVQIASEELAPGRNKTRIDVSSMAEGAYIVVVGSGQHRRAAVLHIVR